jgi:hypothetical protein
MRFNAQRIEANLVDNTSPDIMFSNPSQWYKPDEFQCHGDSLPELSRYGYDTLIVLTASAASFRSVCSG